MHNSALFFSAPKRVQAAASIYALGDSLTADGTYVTELNALLGAPWSVRNRGIGGNTTAQMLARLNTQALNAGDAEYLVVLGGINDIVLGATAEAIESNLQAIYTAAHAAGLRVVAVTLTPYKTSVAWTSGGQAVLDAVNAWILNTATYVDYHVNAYAVLEDPNAADTLLAAYDYGDHLHLSTTGYQLLGALVYVGVAWTSSVSPSVRVSGVVDLNQDLLNTSSPTFAGLTLVNDLAVGGGLSADEGTFVVNKNVHVVVIGGATTAAKLNVQGNHTDFIFALYNADNGGLQILDCAAPGDQGRLRLWTSGGAPGVLLHAYGDNYILGYGGGNLAVGQLVATSRLDVAGDIEVGAADCSYFGDPTTDGSWRLRRSGNNMAIERREAGTYVAKSTITP